MFKALSVRVHRGEKKFWFITRPKLELLEDVVFGEYTVKAGFSFNGATSPWWSWPFIPPVHPEVLAASCLHDYLYTFKLCSRKQADTLFYREMRKNGYYWLGSMRNYYAVRLFGWIGY